MIAIFEKSRDVVHKQVELHFETIVHLLQFIYCIVLGNISSFKAIINNICSLKFILKPLVCYSPYKMVLLAISIILNLNILCS